MAQSEGWKVKNKLQAAIFDLDGVVTQTRDVHISAWTKLFNLFLKSIGSKDNFTESDYNQYVDGRPRYDGAKGFLDSRNINLPWGSPSDEYWKEEDCDKTTVCALGNRKDEMFSEELHKGGAKVYDSTVKVIKDLKNRGILLGVGSSSKNCTPILKECGLFDLFNSVVDGVMLEEKNMKGKPAPDMFLKSLELACANAGREKIPPELVMLSEDATSGVAAGKAGHFGLVVGVNRAGNREDLIRHGADIVIDDFKEISTPQIDEWFVAGAHKAAR